jgi:hypothetical protein
MKTILILTLALSCVACCAQTPTLTFSVAPDTSYILFSGIPKLMVARSGSGHSANFHMARQNFKSLLEVMSYMQGSREVALKSVGTYESLMAKKDSTISVLKLKYETELQRTENFKTDYQNLKLVNQTYHVQLNACAEDLQKLTRQKKKSKAWAFIKGALAGLVVGSVGVIVAEAAL